MEFEVEVVQVASGRNMLPGVVEAAATKVMDIGSHVLAESLSRFLTEFGQVIAQVPPEVGPVSVDEIELALAIAASGDFRIASSTGTASIKIVLRRPSAS